MSSEYKKVLKYENIEEINSVQFCRHWTIYHNMQLPFIQPWKVDFVDGIREFGAPVSW